jgi:purine nucleoside permease
MRLVLKSSIALLLAGLAGGCTSDDYTRSEGVTTGPGNAQAANTVMQMVDPWKYGVQNTRLLVPAKRGDAGPVTPDQAAASKASQATAGN